MTLEKQVIERLGEKGYKISTAESCTGGLIAGTLVNVAGASEVFEEGYITYANQAKIKLLGVSEQTLKSFGAVSEQVASHMAAGCAGAAGAEVGIASTGIAGPDGGSPEKPVGLVYLGCSVKERVVVKRYLLEGDRRQIREGAVQEALKLILESL